MKERPILFKGEMVRAILSGIKTQTRRIVKFNPPFTNHSSWSSVYNHPGGGFVFMDYPLKNPEKEVLLICGGREGKVSPYGVPGDRLWIRESFRYFQGDGTFDFGVRYLADGTVNKFIDNEQKMTYPINERSMPSIHMPRLISRINLIVKNIRIERVNSISEEDAKAEGASPSIVGTDLDHLKYRAGFQTLWNSINEKRGFGWNVNPWVWVIDFEKIV